MKLRLTPILLAGTIAFAGAAPALAFTPVSELKDVSPNHWAYQAIQQLVEKYEVMEGFPDGTFKGGKTLSRYELAAALAKVMARVEQMVASATGQPISLEPGVNPEDLRTIARLQREFRDELEVLKSRVEGLDARVETIEKRVSVGGEVIAEYRDFLGASPLAVSPLADFRVRNRVKLGAALSDAFSYTGSLVWDVYGAQSAGNAFATTGSTTGPFSEIYVERSFGAYKPGFMNAYAGLVNISEAITLGSTLPDPFANNVWGEAIGGYGFVGTPGLAVDPGDPPTVSRLGGANAPGTNPVWWLPGTDVVHQSMDPNATQGIAPRTSLTAAASTDAGPFSVGLGAYMPGMSGRDMTRLATLGYPAGLPGPETYTSGPRMLASVGADFGFVRAQVAAKTTGTFASNLDQFNKTLGASIDLGSDALGLNLGLVSASAFTGNFTPHRASAALSSNDLFGTGFGLGLGANLGTALDTSLATGSQFIAPAGGRSLMMGLSGTDYASYGLMLKMPGFSIFPSLTIAAQQTAGPNFGNTIASGITLQADVQLFEMPRLQVEYSMGKFDPGADNALMNQQTNVSHEQLSARWVLPF